MSSSGPSSNDAGGKITHKEKSDKYPINAESRINAEDCDESVVSDASVRLEDCRGKYDANKTQGRGPGTAAGRGYNAERLVTEVLRGNKEYTRWSEEPWCDNFTYDSGEFYRVEAKSCVEQYPSGGPGRFRFWGHNHAEFRSAAEWWPGDRMYFLYFFVVYTIENGKEKEVGKLIATVAQMNEILNPERWPEREHETMETQPAKDLSWTCLLHRINVSEQEFRNAEIIDLTIRESD